MPFHQLVQLLIPHLVRMMRRHAPETGSVSVLITGADNPFATYTSSRCSIRWSNAKSKYAGKPNMNVTIFDNRVYWQVTMWQRNYHHHLLWWWCTMNGAFEWCAGYFWVDGAWYNKPVSNIFSSDTSAAMGGLLQQNQIAIGTGKAALVATGQVDPRHLTSTFEFW